MEPEDDSMYLSYLPYYDHLHIKKQLIDQVSASLAQFWSRCTRSVVFENKNTILSGMMSIVHIQPNLFRQGMVILQA